MEKDEKVLGSQKQEKPEIKTGEVGICPKCKTEMEWAGIDWECQECVKGREIDRQIAIAQEKLCLPPRLKRHSFENYKPASKKAHEAKKICIEYAADHKDTGGLILVGGVGTGKTHLAAAMCQAVCATGETSYLTTVPRIIRDVRSSWGGKATDKWDNPVTEEDILRKYSTEYTFLVIDEIGSQYGTESEKIIISEIINDRYNNNLPTVIIGNVTIPEAEEYLGVRVIDRLKDNGIVVIFDWKSSRKLNNKPITSTED